jgi:hypothetical protein
MIKIFDLDGTVIDSTHRQTYREDGTLSISTWRENNTPELIAQDKLLPLAKQMRTAYNRGDFVSICTAREIGQGDYDFLKANNLPYNAIVYRTNDLPDMAMKLYGLHNLCRQLQISWARFCKASIMYDDNLSVIEGLTAEGIKVYNATILNRELAR